ncbi:bifunctional diguanylate cyclase/phosphodiesterase [Leptothoe spongobia]|uniref:EAL domain-containing protein n=1 Tax=Leptothoe spongobia TAU-MAC 1115 TaxID=1967444 RepID=A0A947GHE7_9CYAN|nr:bifunctional diguanylate cyclase/phosphodiesterase [Leptothoe spongobia]MBT9315535.1 EAL domain-containing protein [Leptothoe spongobia TAU-MAC 1115]
MKINPNIFDHKIKKEQQRLAELSQQLGQSHPSAALFQEGLEALSTALEEVHVLSEELTAQHSQLQVAQSILLKEHQQYFELFNLAPDGYIVTDPQGIIQQVNLTAASLLNRRQNFLIRKPLSVLIAPSEQKHFYNLLKNLRQGKSQQNTCLHLKPYGGQHLCASFTITVVHNYQSQITGFRWLFRDLTTQQRTIIALEKSQKRYTTLAAAVPVGIFRADVEGNCIYVNERWCQISGLTPEAAHRNGWFQGLHPDDRERVSTQWTQFVLQSHSFQLEFRFQHPDGKVTWVYGQAIPEENTEAGISSYVGSITDITDLKQAQDLIKYNALHDPLTNLPNRTLLLDRLDLNINKANRHQNYSYAVLFLDLDRFKVINDSLGHSVGDQLLIALAQRLKTHLRSIDLVTRLGGDEFVILLEDINDPAIVIHIVERILADSQTPFIIHGHEIFTSLSVGIVLGTRDYHQATDLIRDADIAMYRAKTQEHNSYKFFDEAMHAQSLNRLNLEIDLRKSLEQEAFTIYYQPIFELTNHRLIGFEALVRWQHPTRGLIFPNNFISVTEETGMIVLLDRWIFYKACQQMAEWKHKFANCFPLKISINLSAKDLSKPDLIQAIDSTLAKTGLDGDSIILEITENILIEDIDQTIDLLAQLASRHIQISIDDFGTGYSSLSYLHKLPVHTLKIDRTFVEKIQTENCQYKVVSTILALSKQLGLTVVAEGIETARQLQQLQQLGCQFGQGYLFSHPLAATDIEATFLQGD